MCMQGTGRGSLQLIYGGERAGRIEYYNIFIITRFRLFLLLTRQFRGVCWGSSTHSMYQYTYQTTTPASSDHVIVAGRGGGGGFTGVSIRYAFFPLLGAGGALVDAPARPADERCMTRREGYGLKG